MGPGLLGDVLERLPVSAGASLDECPRKFACGRQPGRSRDGASCSEERNDQAILLAVPPDMATPLDAASVLAIVAETRALAHARMARPADLAVSDALLPTALLPAQGALQVPLDEEPP
jgi:hypothetical protein